MKAQVNLIDYWEVKAIIFLVKFKLLVISTWSIPGCEEKCPRGN